MRHVHALGLTMILGAVLVGAALAVVMFQVEAASRAEQASMAASAAAAPAAPAAPTAQAATPAPTTGGSIASGDVAAGAQVFARTCAACHPNADAGVGPALHGAQFAAKYPDDASIKQVIRNGGTVMPAFPAANLSDADLNAVVAYLRSLK